MTERRPRKGQTNKIKKDLRGSAKPSPRPKYWWKGKMGYSLFPMKRRPKDAEG